MEFCFFNCILPLNSFQTNLRIVDFAKLLWHEISNYWYHMLFSLYKYVHQLFLTMKIPQSNSYLNALSSYKQYLNGKFNSAGLDMLWLRKPSTRMQSVSENICFANISIKNKRIHFFCQTFRLDSFLPSIFFIIKPLSLEEGYTAIRLKYLKMTSIFHS